MESNCSLQCVDDYERQLINHVWVDAPVKRSGARLERSGPDGVEIRARYAPGIPFTSESCYLCSRKSLYAQYASSCKSIKYGRFGGVVRGCFSAEHKCRAGLATLTQYRIELRVTRNCLRDPSTPPARHIILVPYHASTFL
jgi:hypothetical protein